MRLAKLPAAPPPLPETQAIGEHTTTKDAPYLGPWHIGMPEHLRDCLVGSSSKPTYGVNVSPECYEEIRRRIWYGSGTWPPVEDAETQRRQREAQHNHYFAETNRKLQKQGIPMSPPRSRENSPTMLPREAQSTSNQVRPSSESVFSTPALGFTPIDPWLQTVPPTRFATDPPPPRPRPRPFTWKPLILSTLSSGSGQPAKVTKRNSQIRARRRPYQTRTKTIETGIPLLELEFVGKQSYKRRQ